MKERFILNEEQRQLAERHLGIVGLVIHKYIITNDRIFGFEYDDLYQEGCLWLCKAAVSFCPDKQVKFATYAEKVVANGLRTYCRLMCGRQKRLSSVPLHSEPDSGQFALDQLPAEEDFDSAVNDADTLRLLYRMKHRYRGTARLGIEALELKIKGYTGAEIAKMYGVKPNLVGAWISRAASRLRENEDFLGFFGRSVEKDTS